MVFTTKLYEKMQYNQTIISKILAYDIVRLEHKETYGELTFLFLIFSKQSAS